MLRQRFLRPLGLNLFHMGKGIFDAAVGGDDGACPLLPDSGHAGDVVGGVPHQGLHVDKLKRRHPIQGFHILRVIVLHRGRTLLRLGDPNADVFRRQLQKIAVARNHGNLPAHLLALFGHRAQDVVRLKAGQLTDGHLHGG